MKKHDSIRVDPETLKKVQKHKEKTGIPVKTFYDLAAKEKLQKDQTPNAKHNTTN